MCCADDKGSTFAALDLREIVANSFLFLRLQRKVAAGVLGRGKYCSNLKTYSLIHVKLSLAF